MHLSLAVNGNGRGILFGFVRSSRRALVTFHRNHAWKSHQEARSAARFAPDANLPTEAYCHKIIDDMKTHPAGRGEATGDEEYVVHGDVAFRGDAGPVVGKV